MDFALDEFLGPVLDFEKSDRSDDFRVSGKGFAGVKDDASTAAGALGSALIQETRQGQQPARMVGQSSLDVAGISTEADRTDLSSARLGGRG
jgi:hypothetical protein